VRQRLTQFDRAKIRRRPGIAIGHLRHDLALVHRRRSGFQPEIKILLLVQLLNGPDVLGVKRAHTLEGVVIDEDAVPILMGIRWTAKTSGFAFCRRMRLFARCRLPDVGATNR